MIYHEKQSEDVDFYCILGIDTLVSAAGRSVIASQIPWISLASQAGIKRFFPSEYGTDIKYNASSANEVPHQQKLKVREALEKSGLEYTYVVTGPYASAFLTAGRGLPEIGAFDVKARKAVVVGDGKGAVSLTTVGEYVLAFTSSVPTHAKIIITNDNSVGKLVVKALLHPSASRNRALKVNSFTATPLEIVSEFEKQTGAKWEVEFTPFEKVRELEKKAYEGGNPAAVGFTLRRIWGEGGTLYERRDNGLIDGEETETLGDAVRVAIAAQTAD
jgi:NmrA-like family